MRNANMLACVALVVVGFVMGSALYALLAPMVGNVPALIAAAMAGR